MVLTCPDLPVILCTGFNEAITPRMTKSMGLKDFVMKPIVMHQLSAAVRSALDRKE